MFGNLFYKCVDEILRVWGIMQCGHASFSNNFRSFLCKVLSLSLLLTFVFDFLEAARGLTSMRQT